MIDIEPAELNRFADRERFESLCRTGCSCYGKRWSCPPNAPAYEDFSRGVGHLWLILATVEIAPGIKGSEQGCPESDLDLGNQIFGSMKNVLSDLFERLRPWGTPISAGPCFECAPCARARGESCIRPSNLYYSFEAMGLNVGKIAEYYFKQPLEWFGPGKSPSRLTLVTGFLTACPLSPTSFS